KFSASKPQHGDEGKKNHRQYESADCHIMSPCLHLFSFVARRFRLSWEAASRISLGIWLQRATQLVRVDHGNKTGSTDDRPAPSAPRCRRKSSCRPAPPRDRRSKTKCRDHASP